MTDMKPKDANKLNIIELDKSETYRKQNVLRKDGLERYLYQAVEQHRDKKKTSYRLYLE